MTPRRTVLVTSPLDVIDRYIDALVGHPLPHDASLTVVNLVACQPIPTPFGGVDPDETHMLVLVDCEDGGRR